MNKIRFVICGFGHIGKRHATIASGYPGSKVVAVIDSNPDLATHELMPEEAKFFTSFQDFLVSGIPADVITIATPNGFHIPLALQALEANFHIVIEKPMGLNRFDCEQVLFKAL